MGYLQSRDHRTPSSRFMGVSEYLLSLRGDRLRRRSDHHHENHEVGRYCPFIIIGEELEFLEEDFRGMPGDVFNRLKHKYMGRRGNRDYNK